MTRPIDSSLVRAEELWAVAGLSDDTVILGTVGEIDVAPMLGWREIVKRPPQSGDCVISVVGESPFASRSEFTAALSDYPDGTRVCVLIGGDINQFCRLENMNHLALADIVIERVAGLSYQHLRLGVVIRRVKQRQSRTGEQLRDQILIGAFGGVYQALQLAEDINNDLIRTIGNRESMTALKEEKALKERELEMTRSRVHAVLARLDHIEASATWRVGALVIDFARKPSDVQQALKGGLKIWRNRRSRVKGAGSSHSGGIALSGQQLLGNFTLHGLTNETVIALIGSPQEVRKLARTFSVVTLAPHDAIAKLESARPTCLVISTEATRPDSVWCYLGSASALDKEVTLLATIGRARALGLAVFLLKKPGSGGWRTIELACDGAVVDTGQDLSVEILQAISRRATTS